MFSKQQKQGRWRKTITLSGLFIGKLVANTFVTLTPTISAILGYNVALHSPSPTTPQNIKSLHHNTTGFV